MCSIAGRWQLVCCLVGSGRFGNKAEDKTADRGSEVSRRRGIISSGGRDREAHGDECQLMKGFWRLAQNDGVKAAAWPSIR